MSRNSHDFFLDNMNSIKGIIHVGAHVGEELELYEFCNIRHILLFEPLMQPFLKLQEKKIGIAENFALGDSCTEVEMFVAGSHDASSSILEPNLHLLQYPDIKFDRKECVRQITLDSYLKSRNLYGKFNTLNIDVQGYELKVFKGAEKFLREEAEFIICEVNKDYMYKDCALIEDVDAFLENFGFRRCHTECPELTWGNAIYKLDENLT